MKTTRSMGTTLSMEDFNWNDNKANSSKVKVAEDITSVKDIKLDENNDSTKDIENYATLSDYNATPYEDKIEVNANKNFNWNNNNTNPNKVKVTEDVKSDKDINLDDSNSKVSYVDMNKNKAAIDANKKDIETIEVSEKATVTGVSDKVPNITDTLPSKNIEGSKEVDIYAVSIAKGETNLYITNENGDIYEVLYSLSSEPEIFYACPDEGCAPQLKMLQSIHTPCTVSANKYFAIADNNSDACKNAISSLLELEQINEQRIDNELNEYKQSCDAHSCTIASLLCNGSDAMGPKTAHYACPIASGCCD